MRIPSIHGILFLSLLVLFAQAGLADSLELDELFLKSVMLLRPGVMDMRPQATVQRFLDGLNKAVMVNGQHPKIQEWSKEGTVYTLHSILVDPATVRFVHQGSFSLVESVKIKGANVPPLSFFMALAEAVPDEEIEKLESDKR